MANFSPQKSKDDTDIITAGELAIEESKGQEESLATAKDKAQIASASCMSVVQVALLKSLLDKGPEGNRYYVPLLSLVITALAIQVIVGLMSIFLTNLVSYFRRYKDDPRQSCFIHVCQCRCDCFDKDLDVSDSEDEDGMSDIETGSLANPKPTSSSRRCCPCTTLTKEKYEYKAVYKHKKYMHKLIEADLKTAENKKSLVHLDKSKQLLQSRREGVKGNDGSAESKIKEIIDEIEKIDKKRYDIEQNEQLNEVHRDKAKRLYAYVDAIRKNWILKRVTFWQNTLNYLLYVIFILNTFITGLGLVHDEPVAANAAVNTVTTGPN